MAAVALTMTAMVSPCASATATRSGPRLSAVVTAMAPTPTKMRANVPTNSETSALGFMSVEGNPGSVADIYEPAGDLETGVMVPVPEAAPLIARHRLLLDPSAADGMPEHITLLYPFVPVEDCVVEALHDMFREVPAFDFALT